MNFEFYGHVPMLDCTLEARRSARIMASAKGFGVFVRIQRGYNGVVIAIFRRQLH